MIKHAYIHGMKNEDGAVWVRVVPFKIQTTQWIGLKSFRNKIYKLCVMMKRAKASSNGIWLKNNNGHGRGKDEMVVKTN